MSDRKSLSVVIIAKNEAGLLPDCLHSVAWADEIIMLDSGSQDDSVAVAESLGAKVFTHTDWQGFGKQRQLAQSYASHDYILMIDADERVTPELRLSIEQALAAPDENKVYSCARRNLFLGALCATAAGIPTASTACMPIGVIAITTIWCTSRSILTGRKWCPLAATCCT